MLHVTTIATLIKHFRTILKRRKIAVIFLLFLFTTSCNPISPWCVFHLNETPDQCNSARLYYPIHDIVNGVSISIVYSAKNKGEHSEFEALTTYIEVHSQEIPAYKGNMKNAIVRMDIDGAHYQGVAYRHEGGQRIVLPSSLQQILLQALQQNRSVTIQLEGYQAIIYPDSFNEEFKKLFIPPKPHRFGMFLKL